MNNKRRAFILEAEQNTNKRQGTTIYETLRRKQRKKEMKHRGNVEDHMQKDRQGAEGNTH